MPIQQSSFRGDADIIGCVNGQFIAIELKTDSGVLAELQAHKLALIEKAGGRGFVVSPKNFDHFKKVMIALDEGIER
jgi:hypothetical protein